MIFIVIGIIGFAGYTDILPFDISNKSVKLTPTVENIQQISNVLGGVKIR
ncbi:MAG: hypothetical protein OEM28_01475 [Nitrosopumilus sp.]|nr:hypothetical protein [Nitrosopumilus sp.]MDH3486538.1 hypothetical protein [Nitrosopumilus sp.]